MWPVVVLDTEWLKSLGPWLPAKRGRLWVHIGEPIYAEIGGNSRQARAVFAERLVAEYVRLYAEMRVNFELPESIAP